jgi:hypothetical protein
MQWFYTFFPYARARKKEDGKSYTTLQSYTLYNRLSTVREQIVLLSIVRRCNLAGRTGRGCNLGQPRIQNLGVLALGDEKVRRLDVAVDNTLGVRGVSARLAGCGACNAPNALFVPFRVELIRWAA